MRGLSDGFNGQLLRKSSRAAPFGAGACASSRPRFAPKDNDYARVTQCLVREASAKSEELTLKLVAVDADGKEVPAERALLEQIELALE